MNIKKQFEEAQKRNFNANFLPGGKDEKLVKKATKATKATRATRASRATMSDAEKEVNKKKLK